MALYTVNPNVDDLKYNRDVSFAMTDLPTSYGFNAAVGEEWERTPIKSAYRMAQYGMAGRYSKPITEEEWKNSEYFHDDLQWEEGMTHAQAKLIYDRKVLEHKRQDIISRSDINGPLYLAAAFIAQAADPLNIALSFVPVARVAGMSRAAIRANRIAVGAVEGMAGAAIAEIPVLMAAEQEQSDYGITESLSAILLSSAFGAATHGFAGTMSDAFRAKRLRQLQEFRAASREMKTELANYVKEISPTRYDSFVYKNPIVVDLIAEDIKRTELLKAADLENLRAKKRNFHIKNQEQIEKVWKAVEEAEEKVMKDTKRLDEVHPQMRVKMFDATAAQLHGDRNVDLDTHMKVSDTMNAADAERKMRDIDINESRVNYDKKVEQIARYEKKHGTLEQINNNPNKYKATAKRLEELYKERDALRNKIQEKEDTKSKPKKQETKNIHDEVRMKLREMEKAPSRQAEPRAAEMADKIIEQEDITQLDMPSEQELLGQLKQMYEDGKIGDGEIANELKSIEQEGRELQRTERIINELANCYRRL